MRGGVGFVSGVCLSVAAFVLRRHRHLLFGMGLIATGSILLGPAVAAPDGCYADPRAFVTDRSPSYTLAMTRC